MRANTRAFRFVTGSPSSHCAHECRNAGRNDDWTAIRQEVKEMIELLETGMQSTVVGQIAADMVDQPGLARALSALDEVESDGDEAARAYRVAFALAATLKALLLV